MIFGLCGGLGKYFNIDSTVVRIIFVLLTMPGGAGLFIYLVLSIITPLEVGAEMNPKEEMKEFAKKVKKETKEVAEEIKKDKKHGGFRVIIGAIIVAAGIFSWPSSFPVLSYGNVLLAGARDNLRHLSRNKGELIPSPKHAWV